MTKTLHNPVEEHLIVLRAQMFALQLLTTINIVMLFLILVSS